MVNFCTLFDSNYLARGLVLYDSLKQHCPDFHLYVFAFDDKCLEVLRTLQPEHLTVISLADFEDEALLEVKPTRSRAEYCWTCTSSTISYVFKKFGAENCTYLDADMQFFQDPGVLLAEIPTGKSVLITAHRYTRRYDQSRLRGKYCVQFMYFKNDACGREVLEWWRNACIEWCYARVEDGKFGDQKYLDDWTSRFPCVHELQHPGGGLAPWNVQQYTFTDYSGRIRGKENRTGKEFEAVFFHYHGVRLYAGNKAVFAPRSYQISAAVKKYFYQPYIRLLLQKSVTLQQLFPGLDGNGTAAPGEFLKQQYTGHWSWFKRNILRRFFPPAI